MTNEAPSISVVMAAYNEADVIEEAIDSMLCQSIEDFELLIIDDGSTDHTPSIVKSYTDPRVKLIQNKHNIGLPTSLNRGIGRAQGEFIARIDADDRSLPSRLEQEYNALQADPYLMVVGCKTRIIGLKGEPIVSVNHSNSRTFSKKDLLKNGPGVSHGSVMMRRNAVLTVGGYRPEFSLAQDFDLWVRMAEEFGAGFMDIIPEVLYERRISGEQVKKRNRLRLHENYVRYCAEQREDSGSDDDLLQELKLKDNALNPPKLSEREIEARYYYLVGEWLHSENKTGRARKFFVKSLLIDPLYFKNILLLGFSFLPKIIHNRIIN